MAVANAAGRVSSYKVIGFVPLLKAKPQHKYFLIMKKLERNEMKGLKGGLYAPGGTTHCGTCDGYRAPGQPATHEVVCTSLSAGWTCTDLEGQYGLAMQCGNANTGGSITIACALG